MGTLSQNGYGAHNRKQKYNNDGVSQRLKRGKRSEISAQGSARIDQSGMASLGGPTRNEDKPSHRQKKKLNQIGEAQEKSQQIVTQGLLSCLQYLDDVKVVYKGFNTLANAHVHCWSSHLASANQLLKYGRSYLSLAFGECNI